MSEGYTYVLSGLATKRAELSGEIIAAQRRLDVLRANLATLDAAIRMFDPNAKPAKIKPRQRRSEKAQVFRSGELTRAVLTILRQSDRPLTVRKVADKIAQQFSLDMSTLEAAKVVVANVRAALARPHDGLRSEKRGRDPMIYKIIS